MGISDAAALSAASDHACAVLANGTVACWGSDAAGQLGNGTTATRQQHATVLVSGIATATGVSTDMGSSCALPSGPHGRPRGANYDGQPGDIDPIPTDGPVDVTALGGASAIALGGQTACAVLSDETASCSGLNAAGLIGDGATTGPDVCAVSNARSVKPVAANNLSGVRNRNASEGHTARRSRPARSTAGVITPTGRSATARQRAAQHRLW